MARMHFKFLLKGKILVCITILTILLGSSVPVPAATVIKLISIKGLELGKDEYLWGMTLRTKNLRVLAICRIPAGWSISSSNPSGSDGTIEGGASGGVSALNMEQLKELQTMFLIKLSNTIGWGISGVVDIENRGDQPDMAERTLDPENFFFESADRCPALHQ